MTLPIERFKDAYVNHRWNPFTDTDMAVDKEEDGLIIPSGSPFIIQLLEQPRYNDPTSVSVRCYGVDTFVDETSASGQPILKVDDTAGFSPGDTIIINRGGAREEEKIIDTIQAGVSLTVTVNLTYEHTAAQADIVEKFIAFAEATGAPAQSQFRVDYPVGDGGEGTGLIEFNANDANKEVRVSYKATGSPMTSEILDTKLSYPAETPGNDQFLGFNAGAPIWRDFSHANTTGRGTDDHHAQAHSLASHSSKAHSELTGVTNDQHHAKSHVSRHHQGGADELDFTDIDGFTSYLNQAVKSTSSPTFKKITLSESGEGIQGAGVLDIEAGASGIKSTTIYNDTTSASANMYILSSHFLRRAVSALKYKDKVKNLELDPSLIHKLRIVSFDSKCKDDKGRRFVGFAADEVEKIYPDIVTYNEKGEVEGYDHQMLLALAIAELQRLKKQMAN